MLFLSRQLRDVREGGWPALIRKLLMTLDAVLAVPVVLAARLLGSRLLGRPVLIRFGGLPTQWIGALSTDMELYMCERDAGDWPRTWDLFCKGLPECNRQLTRMWERTVGVSRFARAAERVNRWLPGGERNRIPFKWAPIDTRGLFATTRPHLAFTPEEERQGAEALRRLGVPEGRPFVCLHARDTAYFAAMGRTDRQVHRDSDIRTYLPAAEALVRKGYICLRMGALVERPLETDDPQIIDYASRARSDFLDIFLCAHCDFYLGDGAGLYNVPIIFRRPLALVNYIPFEYTTTWSPHDLFIPKRFWLRSERRVMAFREILESGVGRYQRDEAYERAGVEVLDNTPEEIMALALEAEARRTGAWQGAEEDEELQRRFWETFRTHTTVKENKEALWRTHWRIGTAFLRQHRDLLEPSTRPQPAIAWTS